MSWFKDAWVRVAVSHCCSPFYILFLNLKQVFHAAWKCYINSWTLGPVYLNVILIYVMWALWCLLSQQHILILQHIHRSAYQHPSLTYTGLNINNIPCFLLFPQLSSKLVCFHLVEGDLTSLKLFASKDILCK